MRARAWGGALVRARTGVAWAGARPPAGRGAAERGTRRGAAEAGARDLQRADVGVADLPRRGVPAGLRAGDRRLGASDSLPGLRTRTTMIAWTHNALHCW